MPGGTRKYVGRAARIASTIAGADAPHSNVRSASKSAPNKTVAKITRRVAGARVTPTLSIGIALRIATGRPRFGVAIGTGMKPPTEGKMSTEMPQVISSNSPDNDDKASRLGKVRRKVLGERIAQRQSAR